MLCERSDEEPRKQASAYSVNAANSLRYRIHNGQEHCVVLKGNNASGDAVSSSQVVVHFLSHCAFLPYVFYFAVFLLNLHCFRDIEMFIVSLFTFLLMLINKLRNLDIF